MDDPGAASPFMLAQEVADLWGITADQLRRLAHAGTFQPAPIRTPGRRLRWVRTAVMVEYHRQTGRD